MPEEHSEKSNHNNPKDKTPRVAIKDLVVGGQPVGIAHAKLLDRPPASQPHQILIRAAIRGAFLLARAGRTAARVRGRSLYAGDVD
jgi:hypothetical protein